jgi:hypothetical protein
MQHETLRLAHGSNIINYQLYIRSTVLNVDTQIGKQYMAKWQLNIHEGAYETWAKKTNTLALVDIGAITNKKQSAMSK